MIKSMFNKITKGGLVAVLALALVAVCSTGALATGVNIRMTNQVGGPGGTIYDSNGSTPLAAGDLVQIIQAVGAIDAPDTSDAAHYIGGNDIWIADVNVGDGVGGAAGALFSAQGAIDGITIYLRAWNAAALNPAAQYGDSVTHAVPGPPNPPENWDVPDITTDQSIPVPSPGSVRFSSATYNVTEGTASVTITVRRVGGSAGAASVNYATSNGSATAGSDYTAASGTLNWADGDAANKTFNVPITDDAAVEPAETFNVALSGATGASLGSPSSATVTINDNDVALNITTTSLPDGTEGVAYSQTVNATGGTPPYSWSISAGALPAGLSLNASTGQISGTPSAAGLASFTVQVTDAGTGSDTQALSITINSAGSPTVTNVSPNNGDPGATLDVTITGANTSWSGDMSGSVDFGTTDITVNSATAASATSINANITIAGGATPGAFPVTVAGASGSATFTINAGGGGPSVGPISGDGLATIGGYPGQTIVIAGSGFGASIGSSTVTIGGVAANPTAWSDTQIVVAIPDGVAAGSATVVVTTAGGSNSDSITVNSGGVYLDDVEGGSVGTWAVGLANSGYYVYDNGITPSDGPTFNTDAPQTAAVHDGTRGIRVMYSYASGYGGGWGATLANTMDLSAYDTVSFYIQWDGSSNDFKFGLKDSANHAYVASVSNVTLTALSGYGQITLNKSSFTEDVDNSSRTPGALDWADITDYNFTYTSTGTSSNYHFVDTIVAGNVTTTGGGGTPVTGEVVITDIDPEAGPAGTRFTASGSGFGATQGQSILVFENNTSGINYQVEVLSWSDASIEAIVPRLAPVGAYTLKVVKLAISAGTMTALESNPEVFNVTAAMSSSGIATVFPNPFNPIETAVPATRASGMSASTATIAFNASGVTNVGVYIYDSTARLVYHNTSNNTTQVNWDGKDLNGQYVADGVYLLRIVNEDSKSAIAKAKILVIKR